ncbi:hypothetical protein LCGC14_1512260 [marine sediment metagenome]|uniref:Uncharacterized protein n=1 Tax=marine sediment metagenome TaxID=412755 RepID=A0A0F9J156_9ZZZZ
MTTTDRQVATLSSEISVLTPAEAESAEVPFAEGFDLEALKLVDDDPVFATISIRPSRGDHGKGPMYDEDLLKKLETQFNTKRPPGYKGHQKAEDVEWQYREPVTAWVGAQYVTGSDGTGELLVKGYVPTTAADLRVQLKLAEAGADMVNSVSIFGMREVDKSTNRVTDFDLWSLDWTPKGRAGMETELVRVSGEQAKEKEMTREEVIASLTAQDVPAAIAESFRAEGIASVETDVAVAGEMRVILELDDDVDPAAVLEAVRGMTSKAKAEEFATRVKSAIDGSEIIAEMAKEAVKDALLTSGNVDSTDKELAGEISTLLEKPYIKALVDGKTIPVISGGAGGSEDVRVGTRWE